MTLTLRNTAPIGFVTVASSRGGQRTEAVPMAVVQFIAWLIGSIAAQFVVVVLWVAFVEDAIILWHQLSEDYQESVGLLSEWWQEIIEWMAEDVEVRLW